jgi:hypothetical protein
MPIAIKEILLSDSISELSEKINFNFDQIVLAGGGPPGPAGPQGIQGSIGPQGKRGDHWFIGATTTGLTADHDGISELQIQDLFLDSDGNVYKYFEITGSTGWTSTGINLRGPQGSIGSTGGSFEWSIFDSYTGNLIDGEAYGPNGNSQQSSNEVNYLIPTSPYKNSVFLGDPNWSYTSLENFSKNPYSPNASGSSAFSPKLTIVQNEVSSSGFNGLVFGAYGATSGLLLANTYGGVGATTDSFNFVNASFYNDLVGSSYKTKWRLLSPRLPIKIQAGDDGITYANSTLPASLELVSDSLIIRNYDTKNTIKILSPITISGGQIREISINSSGALKSLNATDNTYAYIALQNEPGSLQTMVQHQHGNVIIGPTFGVTPLGPQGIFDSGAGYPVGIRTPQALAIVRDITQPDTIDSGIRFFYPAIKGTPINVEGQSKSQFIGGILPRRNTLSGVIGMDELVISAGSGIGLIPGVTSGGRVGITNNTLHGDHNFVSKYAFNVSIIKDQFTSREGRLGADFVGGPTGDLDYFYAGFDTHIKPSFNSRFGSGIGFAAKEFVDLSGATSVLPIIQTYYRQFYGDSSDSSQDVNSGVPNPFGVGDQAPNLYIQPNNGWNGWGDVSNVAIGFVPENVRGYASGTTAGHYPFSKLSIAGSVTIAGKTSGYHTIFTVRPKNGLLIQGNIIQGAKTGINQFGSSLFSEVDFLLNTPITGNQGQGGGPFYGPLPESLSASFNKLVMASTYMSRASGIPSPFPEFGFADARTGIRMKYTESYILNDYVGATYGFRPDRGDGPPYSGKIGVGQLVSSPAHQLNDFSQSKYLVGGADFKPSKVVAEWASSGDFLSPGGTRVATSTDENLNAGTYSFVDYGYQDNTDYSSFKVTDTFSQSYAYNDISNLVKKYVAFDIDSGGPDSYRIKHRAIYYKIPTNKSIFYLEGPGTYFGTFYDYIDSDGNIRRLFGAGSLYHLNGLDFSFAQDRRLNHRDQARLIQFNNSKPTDGVTTTIPIWRGSNTSYGNYDAGWKRFNAYWPSNFAYVDEGHYVGQEFTLVVGNMNPNNELYLDATPPNEAFLKDWNMYQSQLGTLQLPNIIDSIIPVNNPENVPGLFAPYSANYGGSTGWNNNNNILKSKARIVFPKGADSDILSPSSSFGKMEETDNRISTFVDGATSIGTFIERSSSFGNKLGVTLKANTVYKFIWLPGDLGFKDFSAYNAYSAGALQPTSPNTGDFRYFKNDFGGITSENHYFITGLEYGKNTRLGDTRFYSNRGGYWLCLSMEKLVARNFYDYGSVNPLIKFNDWNW